MKQNIFFLGCGKMGTIILKNLLNTHIFDKDSFLILKPSNANKIKDLNYISDYNNIKKDYLADIVFICIKPQNASKVLDQFSKLRIFHKNTVFISILAGKNTSFFKKFFGHNSQIVRSMPNTAIEVNEGIIPVFFDNVDEKNKILTKDILKNCGLCFEINDENLFHPLTALYGCGPAYIFLLQEIFENLAKKYSISPKIIHELTIKLFLGSSIMTSKYNKSFNELRSMVTSKKGVTEASLKHLIKNNKLQNIFSKALDNGIKKSKKIEKL